MEEIQATNEETISGEGDSDGDDNTQAVPPVSPLIEFGLISPQIGILIDILIFWTNFDCVEKKFWTVNGVFRPFNQTCLTWLGKMRF